MPVVEAIGLVITNQNPNRQTRLQAAAQVALEAALDGGETDPYAIRECIQAAIRAASEE